jgi:uncharacterized protein YndB with AHSA1/START domain
MSERTFDRLLRARLAAADETPDEARAALLAGDGAGPPVPFPVSDEELRRRTGRGWEQWLDLLDERGASERPAGEVANWVFEQHGIDPRSAQVIAIGYERAQGGRTGGHRSEGFEVRASKTVSVPVERLFEAFVDAAVRERWLPDAELRERTSRRPRSVRFDWAEGEARLHATFEASGASTSSVSLRHLRVPDAEEAARLEGFWEERLSALRALLED